MSQTILEECDRLAEIINTTVEIARTESGLIELHHSPLDLRELLLNAAERFLPVAEEKQINLSTDIATDPLVLFGEKCRSSQGNGLGPCLARTLAQAHGGSLTVRNNPAKGCTFSVCLPRGDS